MTVPYSSTPQFNLSLSRLQFISHRARFYKGGLLFKNIYQRRHEKSGKQQRQREIELQFSLSQSASKFFTGGEVGNTAGNINDSMAKTKGQKLLFSEVKSACVKCFSRVDKAHFCYNIIKVIFIIKTKLLHVLFINQSCELERKRRL